MSQNEVSIRSQHTVVINLESKGEHGDIEMSVKESVNGSVRSETELTISAYTLHKLVREVLADAGFPYNTIKEGL